MASGWTLMKDWSITRRNLGHFSEWFRFNTSAICQKFGKKKKKIIVQFAFNQFFRYIPETQLKSATNENVFWYNDQIIFRIWSENNCTHVAYSRGGKILGKNSSSEQLILALSLFSYLEEKKGDFFSGIRNYEH